jgi:hypothetical protein
MNTRKLPLVLLLLCVGCDDSQTSPAATNANTDAGTKAEEEFQSSDEIETSRAAARRAALAYARQRLPDWNVKGVATVAYSGNQYSAVVEVEKGGQGEFLNLYVTNLFAEDGQSHWAAELTDKSLADVIHNLEDAKINKQLNAAKGGEDSNER